MQQSESNFTVHLKHGKESAETIPPSSALIRRWLVEASQKSAWSEAPTAQFGSEGKLAIEGVGRPIIPAKPHQR